MTHLSQYSTQLTRPLSLILLVLLPLALQFLRRALARRRRQRRDCILHDVFGGDGTSSAHQSRS
jgi:hypothetical protein